jgi:flagellar biosynthetic protein FliR
VDNFLSAMTLALVRVSGMVAFAPFFSSTALPMRTKAVFVGAVALAAGAAGGHAAERAQHDQLFGHSGRARRGPGLRAFALALLSEMLLFAGQIAGCSSAFRWST